MLRARLPKEMYLGVGRGKAFRQKKNYNDKYFCRNNKGRRSHKEDYNV